MVFLDRSDPRWRTPGSKKAVSRIAPPEVKFWIEVFHLSTSFATSRPTLEPPRYPSLLLAARQTSGKESERVVVVRRLHRTTASIAGAESVMVAAELACHQTAQWTLAVENVMAEAELYRPLARWVSAEESGIAEEEQGAHRDQTKIALASTFSPWHESPNKAVDSLLSGLLFASPVHDLVEAATAERLRQYSLVGCFGQECLLCR
jgi:hypothetical protein